MTSWDNRDEAWLDVAKGIINSIEDLRSRQPTAIISPSIGDNDGPIPGEESVALIFAQTITGRWADRLRKPAWYVNMGTFYRVMLLLKGDRAAQGWQFPPPPDDEMAWFDLYRYSDQASIPDGVEDFVRNQIMTDPKFAIRYKPTDPAYVLVSGGYYWFTLHMAAVTSLDEACGRRLFVTQK